MLMGKMRFRVDIGKGNGDIGHGMQASDTYGNGKGYHIK